MRESIGGAMMLRIILIVIVLFFIFLCISANYARAFRVKNGVINIIEQYQGVNSKSIPRIENYVKQMGYSCKSSEYSTVTNYILKDKDTGSNLKGEYLGSERGIPIEGTDNNSHPLVKDRIYNIQVCVNWNFPFLDLNGTWTINGRTDIIKDSVYS